MEELDGITTTTLDITTGATLSTSSNGSYYTLDGTSSINNISSGNISTSGNGYAGTNYRWDARDTQLTPEQRLENLIDSIENLSQSMEGLRREVVVLAKEIKKEKFDKRTLKTR